MKDPEADPANSHAHHLAASINNFIQKRLDEKKRQYESVLRRGFFVFLICYIIYVCNLFLGHPLLSLMYSGFNSMGAITCSVCPLDELDVDDFIATHPRYRTFILLFFAGFDLYLAWAYFPHLHVLSAMTLLWAIFGGSMVHVDHTPRATTLCAFNIFLRIYANGFHLLFMSIRTPHDNDILLRASSGFLFLSGSILTARWIYVRSCSESSRRRQFSTFGFYEALYGWFVVLAVKLLFFSGVDCGNPQPTACLYTMASGVLTLIPVLMVLFFGREAVFGFMARRFDRNCAEKDGAFLAEMFTLKINYTIGDKIWITRDMFVRFITKRRSKFNVPNVLEALAAIPNNDDRSNWLEGSVISISEAGQVEMALRHFTNGTIRLQTEVTEDTTIPELLAKTEVRYVEWDQLTAESIQSYTSGGEFDMNSLSRPLGKSQRIDFFVCHSWRDCPVAKWGEIVQIAANFRAEKGRNPTFWIDKYCLRVGDEEQSNALKSLTIIIMACDRMILLCGTSFPTRLWCAWELFTILAFPRKHQAMKRILLIPMGPDDGQAALWNLQNFNVADATCFSPYDEMRIMAIIDAVGRKDFNEKISSIAKLERSIRDHGCT